MSLLSHNYDWRSAVFYRVGLHHYTGDENDRLHRHDVYLTELIDIKNKITSYINIINISNSNVLIMLETDILSNTTASHQRH